MKYSSITVMLVATLVFSKLAIGAESAAPPTSATAAKTVLEMWKLKKFDKIESFIAVLSKKYPKRICTIVGSAFVDQIFHADVDKAQQKLELVRSVIDTAHITVSEKFDGILDQRILRLSMFDTMMEGTGMTKADLKRSANVAKTRETYGSKIPELLELMALAPNADLP